MSADRAPRRRRRPARRARRTRQACARWLADRLGLAELEKAVRGGHVPGGASLWHALGSVAAGLFVLEAVTGILLATRSTRRR